jgi:hypothetical protein
MTGGGFKAVTTTGGHNRKRMLQPMNALTKQNLRSFFGHQKNIKESFT